MESFEIKKICTNLRPAKVVTLVPKGFDWRKKCVKIIEFYSQTWGGAKNFIVPTDGEKIDEKFWELMEKFDPDYFYIFFEKGGKNKISEDLRKEILRRLNPFFYEIDEHLIEGKVSNKAPRYPLTFLADIITNTEFKSIINNPIIDYSFTKQIKEYLELMGYSELGKMTEDYSKKIEENKKLDIEIKELSFSEGNIGQFFQKIWEKNDAISVPYSISMINLNKYYKGSFLDIDDAPLVLVVGSTQDDFCLYYNLSRLRDDVLWIPFSLIKAVMGEITRKEDTKNFLLPFIELVSRINDEIEFKEKETSIITSFSKTESDLLKIKDNLNYISEKYYLRPIDHLIISKNLNEVLDYKYDIFEVDNYSNCYTEQFINHKSVNPIKTPIPRRFRHRSFHKHYWITDVSIEGYKLPQTPILSDSVTAQLYSNHEIRVSKNGISFFCPNTSYFGHSIDKYIVKPDITLLEPYEIFEKIFEKYGYHITTSDKGNYERESTEMFGSLEQLSKFLKNEKYQSLFNKFIEKNNPSSPDEGIFLKDDNRMYMSLKSIEKTLGDEIHIISDFVRKNILHRGFIFKCEKCQYTGWYDIADVNNKFKCRRCRKIQYYDTKHLVRSNPMEPEWFYKLDEAFYQGYDNDMIVPVLTLNKLKNLTKESFLYTNEIKIEKSSKSSSNEIDIICICDGKIIIGECKLGNELDNDEIKKYKWIYKEIGAYKIIFSTFDEKGWSDGTLKRIKKILGEEINYDLLNKKELYS